MVSDVTFHSPTLQGDSRKVHPGFCRNSSPHLPLGGEQAEWPLGLKHRRTDGHVEQLARSHDGEEAVHVVEHGQEHFRLGGGCRLRRV